MTRSCTPSAPASSARVTARRASALPSPRLARRRAGAGRDRVRRVRAPVQRRPELPRLADLLRPRRLADARARGQPTTPPPRSAPVEPHKAWREQFHRMIAGALGVLVLALALLAARRRRYGVAQVLVRVGAGRASRSRCTCRASTSPPRCSRSLGEAMLLFAALRWSNMRPRARRRADAGGDHLPGPARHVDGDLAAQAHRGDGAPARRPAHVLAAGVDGVARDRPADPPRRGAAAARRW